MKLIKHRKSTFSLQVFKKQLKKNKLTCQNLLQSLRKLNSHLCVRQPRNTKRLIESELNKPTAFLYSTRSKFETFHLPSLEWNAMPARSFHWKGVESPVPLAIQRQPSAEKFREKVQPCESKFAFWKIQPSLYVSKQRTWKILKLILRVL